MDLELDTGDFNVSKSKYDPLAGIDFSIDFDIGDPVDFIMPVNEELDPAFIKHVGKQIGVQLSAYMTNERACNLSVLSRIGKIEVKDEVVDIRYQPRGDTSYYDKEERDDAINLYLEADSHVYKQKLYAPDFSVPLFEGNAAELAQKCYNHYVTPPKIDQVARGINEFAAKEHYFNLLTKLSGRDYSIESILVVGCGASPMVDFVRLEKSGFLDLSRGEVKITFIDPMLHLSSIKPKFFKTTNELKFFADDLHQHVKNVKNAHYDLILFPMSFHVVADDINFFEDLMHISTSCTIVLGMMPNPDIYNNPICAAINQCSILSYDAVTERYTVLNNATKMVFSERKFNVENFSQECFENGYACSFGTNNTYGLINTGIPGRLDAVQTILMYRMPIDKFNLDKMKFAVISLKNLDENQFRKGDFGFYKRFVPNHCDSSNRSSILRTLGEHVYYSSKIDGYEALLCVKSNAWAIQTHDGFIASSTLFDKDYDYSSSLIFHIELNKSKSDFVVIDLVHDILTLSVTDIDRADSSFVVRKQYLSFYTQTLGFGMQNYVRNFSELQYETLEEGVVLTPFNSSRCVVSGKKILTSGSTSVKNMDELGFCIGVDVVRDLSKVKIYLEFKLLDTSNKVEFQMVRMNKVKNSIPEVESLTWDQFIKFSMDRESFRADVLMSLQNVVDFKFGEEVFRRMIGNTYGVVNSASKYPLHLVGKIMDMDHVLGSDSCACCSEYARYLKCGYVEFHQKNDEFVVAGYKRNINKLIDLEKYNKERLAQKKTKVKVKNKMKIKNQNKKR